MNQILRCDLLPGPANCAISPPRDYLLCPAKNSVCFFKFHKIDPLLTKLLRSRWLDIDLVLFRVFM